MRSGRCTAIIGGGFSGTVLAIHLLQKAGPDDSIILFEKTPPFGLGVAYSTDNDSHLLNVPAFNMGMSEENRGAFLEWLNDPEASGDIAPLSRPVPRETFAPRRHYGRYLQHCLQQALAAPGGDHGFRPVEGEAAEVRQSNQTMVVRLKDGRSFEADQVVLALGNQPPDQNRLPLYAGDPWDREALADLAPDANLLLVGTGLTMIDTVLSLADRGHRGRIHAVSRRGLLPQPYPSAALTDTPLRFEPELPSSTVAILRIVRAEIRRAMSAGHSWHEVIQALRPHAQATWTRLPNAEKSRFLRHLRPWWDTHRHCIAPGAAARVQASMQSGQLTVKAGRIVSEKEAGDAAEVMIRLRGSSRLEHLRVARVINCTGPRREHAGGQSELLRGLIAEGLARPDELELGLDVDRDGFVLDREGKVSPKLAALGPLTRGLLWEITAVPEIRRQCAALANRLEAGEGQTGSQPDEPEPERRTPAN